jgi:hypothetical protein
MMLSPSQLVALRWCESLWAGKTVTLLGVAGHKVLTLDVSRDANLNK